MTPNTPTPPTIQTNNSSESYPRMSRRYNNHPSDDQDEREVSTPSLDILLRPTPYQKQIKQLQLYNSFMKSAELSATPDRRAFRPDKTINPPASIRRGATRIRTGYHPRSLNFHTPNLIALCVRRKVRKEVLHALRKAGKGGQKKRKLNFWSRIGC